MPDGTDLTGEANGQRALSDATTDCFTRAEMLFDSLADDLADPVARVPRSAAVDCAAARPLIIARDMRCHVASAAIVHEVAGVMRLGGAD